MIRRLRGKVIEHSMGQIVLDVHGVGYAVAVPKSARYELDQELSIHIHTHVREDALALFGFEDPVGLAVFELLLGVPTIGPVKAMAILETQAQDFVATVRAKDTRRLAQFPGVGKKTADRIVMDLYDKLDGIGAISTRPIVATGSSAKLFDLVSALTNLGFKPSVAEENAKRAMEKLGQYAKLEELLREALAAKH